MAASGRGQTLPARKRGMVKNDQAVVSRTIEADEERWIAVRNINAVAAHDLAEVLDSM